MFDTYYKLSTRPFVLAPDPRFFFAGQEHSRAMAHLVYGLSQREGFIVVTGEVGAGKTTLMEQLRVTLDPQVYKLARVVTTQVMADDLLYLVMAGFGLEMTGICKAGLLCAFEQQLREQHQKGRICLLVIDEVQSLPQAALEELRMLSNITVDGGVSAQIILFGQPEFRRTLASRKCDPLRQRVLVSFHLGSLSETETQAYVEHRLRMAGWQGDPSWDDLAFRCLHGHTGGIPRRIHTLCSRVLLLGALLEVHRITSAMVDRTADELRNDLGTDISLASTVEDLSFQLPGVADPTEMLPRAAIPRKEASLHDLHIIGDE